MANLADTAQMTMDLFYQQYKGRTDFFRLNHFLYLCGVAYSKLLEDEYKEARMVAKAEEGFSEVFLQDDWLTEETVKMRKVKDEEGVYEGKLKTPVFTFPYDPYTFGIQMVRKTGKTTCTQFIRTSQREAWMDCHLPATNRIFFYVNNGRLRMNNSRCNLDELKVSLVPEITDVRFGQDGGPVPSSKQDTIIRRTLELMFRAREGNVVDMSNNSNPNKALATEVDNMFQNLRTKPI